MEETGVWNHNAILRADLEIPKQWQLAEQRNDRSCMLVSEQVQWSNGKQNDQSKKTHNKGGINTSNPSNQESVEYHNNFQQISNNYSRYEPNSQYERVNKQCNNIVQTTARNPNSQQQVQNCNNNAKNEKNSEPAPYTLVESFAARLRYNQSKN